MPTAGSFPKNNNRLHRRTRGRSRGVEKMSSALGYVRITGRISYKYTKELEGLMKIKLSEHFTYKKLLQFTMPTVVMMVFTSLYGIVDGLFVSNLVGKTAFAAVNLILPFPTILSALGFMVGAGGSALVSKTMGEGNREKANSLFSLMVYVTAVVGTVICVIGVIFVPQVAVLLGAQGDMVEICVLYGRIYLCALPLFMLQYLFQSFLVAAEKPRLGLAVTVAAGVANMVLDALFMAVFHWGVAGAALATAISQAIGGGIPLVYFLMPNTSRLRLGKTRLDGKALWQTCTNGSSELMSNISSNIVNILFNYQLMRLAGENGVSAYGVIMYCNFIFTSAFLGYSTGSAPIISFHYGAEQHGELKSLLKKSVCIIGVLSVVLTGLAEVLALPLSRVFVGYDSELLALTYQAFRIYSIMFLFCGFNIYGSAFFTALNNGPVSAAISFLRTLVFQIGCVLILPVFWEIDGIWLSVVAAELLSLLVTVFCIFRYRNRYHYL